MAVIYKVKELEGNRVNDKIILNDKNQYACSCYDDYQILFTSINGQEITKVNVGIKDDVILVKQMDEVPDSGKELVIVHEYQPGCGAKRWPGFWIDWDNAGEVEILKKVSRTKGSGCDVWSLITAPVGWAENIAGQFINERDFGTQTISYKKAEETEVEDDDTPYSLFVAFGGDKEKISEFILKVSQLNPKKIDSHILLECGRGKRKDHLEKISNDPDFFLGSDPNAVALYVAAVHGIE